MHALLLTPSGLDLQTLVRAAADVGIGDAWVITSNAGDSIQPESAPDLIIAILGPSAPASTPGPDQGWRSASPFTNLDVALRAGRECGRGVPVVMIVPPPLRRPMDLAGLVIAQCPLDDYDALRLHLWAFVSTLPGRAHLEAPPSPPPAEFDADTILSQLEGIDSSDQPTASLRVERLMASLLSQVGAELVENPDRGSSNSQFDLAILPSRDSGDIVLVEVKAGRLTENALEAAEMRLANSVLERNAALGVVLYHDFGGGHFPGRRTIPLIIRMSVRELVGGLAYNSLPQLIAGVVRDAIRRM